MLSVCIPVYNFYISALYNELIRQATVLELPFEIICIDDCSADQYKNNNKQAVEKSRYIQLKENIGRAKIRNLFLQYAQYENLLFLDCDSIIIKQNFLAEYITQINQNKDYNVICGGRIYNNQLPDKKYRLRWLYGRKRESSDFTKRNQSPNSAFMSNNFLIKKAVLSEVRFEERLTDYGHEDTLFGFALQQEHKTILHINNPVLNGHLETNEEYFYKTEKAVANLAYILQYINNEAAFINDVKLLRIYNKTKRFHSLIISSFTVLKPIIKRLLIKGYINLKLFDFYKLATLIKNLNNRKTLS